MTTAAPPQPPAFRIDEGSVTLPAGFQDRTANIFVIEDKLDTLPNLSIARDRLLPKEAPQDYVTRQLGLLKSKMPGHKLDTRTAARLGSDPHAIAGEEIQASYRSGGATIHQRQAAFVLADGASVLIFSASSPRPFTAAFDAIWRDWLASFVPRAAEQP